MTGFYQHDSALTSVVRALAATGQDQKAADLAGEAADLARACEEPPELEGFALITVVEAVTAAGQHQLAAHFARTDIGLEAAALIPVVKAMAAAGQHQQAADLARTITEPDRQTQTLLTLVNRCKRPTEKSLLLAEALALGEWMQVLQQLPDLAPEALEPLARSLLPLQRIALTGCSRGTSVCGDT